MRSGGIGRYIGRLITKCIRDVPFVYLMCGAASFTRGRGNRCFDSPRGTLGNIVDSHAQLHVQHLLATRDDVPGTNPWHVGFGVATARVATMNTSIIAAGIIPGECSLGRRKSPVLLGPQGQRSVTYGVGHHEYPSPSPPPPRLFIERLIRPRAPPPCAFIPRDVQSAGC